MNRSGKWRLAALGLAVSLAGAATVFLVLHTEQRVRRARAQLGEMGVESFQIGDGFKQRLRQANDHLRRYASTGQREAWPEFLAACQELAIWIEQQAPRLNASEERAALASIRAGYSVYQQRAEQLHARLENAREVGASLAEYNSFFEQSRRLADLGQDLARAHFEHREAVLSRANRTLAELGWSVIASLVLLLVLGLGLAGVGYRDLVAPLRVKLQESKAVAQRNEKLASLGLLAAGVAHEIRNPLTALKTALFLHQRNLPAEALEHAGTNLIESEILRLERIVNEFLSFARPAPPQPTIFPAAEALRQVQELLAPQLAADDIQLWREPGAPMQVQADPGQIQQVLINLVHNAAESIGRNGTITLRACLARRRLGGTEKEVVILEVVDTGKGIPPEVQKRLFDPFFTTKPKGTGLGLSIAARIVELNGGVLEFQTQLKRGSTFGIVLPRVSTGAATRSPSPGEHAAA